MTPAATMEQPTHESSGGRLVAKDGRTLPFLGASIRADAQGGLCRTLLTQRFRNPYEEPLTVTYLLPLPEDGAVSGFTFQVANRRIIGEIDRRAAARERFEEALLEGRSAALVEQERTSLFAQEIGNIPPRTDVVCEIVLDQRLRWLDEGSWEWRFPTVVMPRYQGAIGRVPSADRVTVEVAEHPLPPRVTIELSIRDRMAGAGRPESPSHALRVREGGLVELAADGGVALDRDLVVRWPVAERAVGLALDVARPGEDAPHGASAYGLLSIVPPAAAPAGPSLPRDLCILLDTSGSMAGEPLDQARKVVLALLATLGEADRLEMVEFSNRPSRWKQTPVAATAAALADARAWLAALEAGGCTEMREGLYEALAPLRAEAQRQIVLVTDGAIGFEQEIVTTLYERLPRGSRLHTVGVGPAVNRSLTAAAARAGRGAEIIVGLGEDVERPAARLCARTAAPVLVEIELSGGALCEQAPRALPDLHAGAPALVAVRLRPEGGELFVRGRARDGVWEARVDAAPAAPGSGNQGVVQLFGREKVEDLEMGLAAGAARGEGERAIERVGLEFQIATRLTSWIAVSEEPTASPRAPRRRERIAHELPHGLSVEGLGLRAPMAGPMLAMRSGAAAPVAFAGKAPRMDVRGQLRGMFGAIAPDDSPPRGFVETPAGATPKTQAPLRGRLVRRKGRELTIELEVIEWRPPADATLVWDDGTRSVARVDEAHTTWPGQYGPGQIVRLALVLLADPAPTASPQRVLLGMLVIELV